jgi:hypothetical protein
MESILDEKVSIFKEKEALDTFLEKCKRSIPPITREDYWFRVFLELEASRVIKRLKPYATSSEIKVHADVRGRILEWKKEIDEMQSISEEWSSYSLSERILNHDLISKYDNMRRDIDYRYSLYETNAEYINFLEEVKKYSSVTSDNSKNLIKRNRKNKPVIQLHKLTGEVIKKYESIAEAALTVGSRYSSRISECCSGKCESACGYKWRYDT